MAQQDRITAGPGPGGQDEIGEAARHLRDEGFVVLPAAAQSGLIGTTPESWERFDRHWDKLTLDNFMKDGGTYRYRRYGRYGWRYRRVGRRIGGLRI